MTVEQRRSGMTLEQRISILTLDHNQQQAATPAFVRSEPYSYKRPSQPYIDVPTRLIDSEPGAPLELSPIVTADLSSSDAVLFKRVIQDVITRHGKIVAEQQKGKWQAGWRYNDSWVYALRYKAQCVLDHLWIGPLSVVRDVEFLRREGFSMVLVARDERLANTRLPTLHEACRVLDLASRCFAIDCKGRGLVGQLAGIMDAIKTHVVAVERRRGTHESSRRAKILIVCNTGNELAPGIAAAYLMAVFGQTLTQAFETVMTARYSCAFDEGTKQSLVTWAQMVEARMAVAAEASGRQQRSKRRLDDMMEEEEGGDMDGGEASEREAFAPFVDVSIPES